MQQGAAPNVLSYPLRILFTGGEDWFSVGVRAWTKSPAGHVAVAFGPRGEHIVHAMGKGVLLESRDRLYAKYLYYDVAEFAIKPDVREGFGVLLSQVGKPYDRNEISSRFTNAIVRMVCPWIPKATTTVGQWTCARMMMLLDPTGTKIPEWANVDWHSATAGDLYAKALAGHSFSQIK